MSITISTNNLYFKNSNGDLEAVSAIVGAQGPDGYSPSASVTKTTTGATITIKDKSGTTTADITNGSDANVTSDNIKSALGYTPVDSSTIKAIATSGAASDVSYEDSTVYEAIKGLNDDIAKTYSLDTGTAIDSSKDLDDLITPSVWHVSSKAAKEVDHGPITNGAYKLVVDCIISSDDGNKRIKQTAIINGTSASYIRYYNNSWSDWEQYVYKSTLDTELKHQYELDTATNISVTDDSGKTTKIDQLFTPGAYYVASMEDASALSKELSNPPEDLTNHAYKLIVNRLTNLNRTKQTAIINGETPNYERYFNGTSWSDWRQCVYDSDIKNLVDNVNMVPLTEGGYIESSNSDVYYKAEVVDGKIRVIGSSDGTSPVSRYFILTNGYKKLGWSKSPFYEILPAGTYVLKLTASIKNAPDGVSVSNTATRVFWTYSTFGQISNENENYKENGEIFTLDKPAMLGIAIKQGDYYGSGTDYTEIEYKIFRVSAKDDGARASIDYISSRYPENTAYSRKLNTQISKLKLQNHPSYATLPYQNCKIGVTKYYDVRDTIGGILYSSVWRDGRDVYRNLNLETYYSALENPASVLYTRDYTDYKIKNGHSWYGGVCSTFVTYISGKGPYTTTSELSTSLANKNMDSVYDLEVGDILWKSGHVAMISQVYTDGTGSITAVDISEQSTPVFKTTTISIDEVEEYLNNEGYVVKDNPYNGPKSIYYNDFNHNVIFEKGNNTYVNLDEVSDDCEMWFYIKNASTIFIKKDNGEYKEFSIENVQQKVVNDVNVYDLSSCFNSVGGSDLVGTYYITDDISEYPCRIKVIDCGNITLKKSSDNSWRLTMSDWKNCTPLYYYVITVFDISSITAIEDESEDEGEDESEDESEDKSDIDEDSEENSLNGSFYPDDGYFCSYRNKCGEISIPKNASSVSIDIPSDYVPTSETKISKTIDIPACGFKLWIEMDTGLGYKQVFSNVVDINDSEEDES